MAVDILLYVRLSLSAFLDFVEFIIAIIVTYYLYYHFYQCKKSYINCIFVWCIGFSDRHNWINEPSSLNKITAILSSFLYSLKGISWTILITLQLTWIISEETYKYSSLIPGVMWDIATTLYFYYLIITLKDGIKIHPVSQVATVSNKLIVIAHILIVLNCCRMIILQYLFVITDYNPFYKDIPYIFISDIMDGVIRVSLELLLLFLYCLRLNRICQSWFRKCTSEYGKYGETQRIHETLIAMTRGIVCIIISSIITIINVIWSIANYYFVGKGASYSVAMLGYSMITLFSVLDDLSSVLSMYFIYEFGYDTYRKYLGRCHENVYDFCKRRHNKQFEQQLLINQDRH